MFTHTHTHSHIRHIKDCRTIHALFHGRLFLGVFAKLRKAAIKFAISVCLSVRPHGTTQLPLD